MEWLEILFSAEKGISISGFFIQITSNSLVFLGDEFLKNLRKKF
jgi:hypothetical protein